nr:hypothetical protein [Streptomyces sp. SID5468]
MGLAWCAAVAGVVAEPARSGPVEQGLALGGWTLSLLPVHVTPWVRARRARHAEPASTAVAPQREGPGSAPP